MSSFRFMRRDSSRLRWRLPSTWTDRLDRDRTPSITGHEPAGVVTALGYGTTGPSVGQRVFSLDGARLRRAGVRRPRERRPGGPRRRRPGFRCHGGDIGKRSAGLIRAGGRVVSVVGPPETRPADGLAIDFVVESDRAQLGEVVQRVRDGRLRTNIGNVATLDEAVAALNPTDRVTGKTIIRIRP